MDLYIVLGVRRGASADDIRRAYKRLARRYHPDINPGDHEAAERFRDVLSAYETLVDPERRRLYDHGEVTAVPPRPAGFAGFDFSPRVHAERTTTFGDLFGGVFLPPWGKMEQWTFSVQHGPDDVDRAASNLERFARDLHA